MSFYDPHKQPSDHADTYVNGLGFLPNSAKQRQKKELQLQIALIVFCIFLIFLLRFLLELPIFLLLRLFDFRILVNPMTGLISSSNLALYLSSVLLYFFPMLIGLSCLYLCTRSLEKAPKARVRMKTVDHIRWLFMLLGVASLGQFVVQLLTQVPQQIGIVINSPTISTPQELPALLLYLLLIIVLPAVMEELFFRGLVLRSLRRFDDLYCIIVTALLYALFQNSIQQLLFGIVFGMALCFYRICGGRLWVCMMANLIIKLGSFLTYQMQLHNTTESVIFSTLLESVTLLIASFCFYRYVKTHIGAFRLQPDQSLLTNREKTQCLITSLAFWGLVVFSFFNIIDYIEIIN